MKPRVLEWEAHTLRFIEIILVAKEPRFRIHLLRTGLTIDLVHLHSLVERIQKQHCKYMKEFVEEIRL